MIRSPHPKTINTTRTCLALIGEQVSLDAKHLWQSFDCHFAREMADNGSAAAEAYAEDLGISCLALLRALDEMPDERNQLHPFLNGLAAISEWCFATGNDIDAAVRPYTAGYVDMLIACGQPVADEHAQHIAFDYATRLMFGIVTEEGAP